MKFQTTPPLDADFRRLKKEHAAQFKKILREKFIPTCRSYQADFSRPWPASLRIKTVRGTPVVLEMTWSFASPDGRATFELVTADGGLVLRWRPVGDHGMFRKP